MDKKERRPQDLGHLQNVMWHLMFLMGLQRKLSFQDMISLNQLEQRLKSGFQTTTRVDQVNSKTKDMSFHL